MLSPHLPHLISLRNLSKMYELTNIILAGRGTALIGVTGQGSTPPHGITIDLADEGRVVDTWGSGTFIQSII